MTGHYILGSGVSRSRLLEPRYDIAGREIEADYLQMLSPGGTGYAVDVGAALQATPRLVAGARSPPRPALRRAASPR